MNSLRIVSSFMLVAVVSANYEGYGTVYTLSTPSSGNCNFMSWPEDATTKYAALNVEQWEETMNCGRCAEVSCTDASCAGQSSEIVYIMDQCPGCEYGDLDLSPSVFESITGQSYTKLSIEWKFVDCPVSNNVQYCLKTGSSEFWVAVQPANFVSGVQSLSINGQETSVIDSAYYFLIDGSGKSVADLSSVSISLTGVNGEVLEETLSLTADECANGNSQFSSSGGTSQSTITSTKSSTTSPPVPTTAPPTATPVTEAPTTSPPVPTTAPPTASPVTEAPTTSPPVPTTAPPTATPVTEAPTTSPPTTVPVTTLPPTSPPTMAPVTEAPTTTPPTTAPVTEAPTTAQVTTAPVTTSPPTEVPTTAPVTEEPTEAPTAAPVTKSPTTAPVTETPTSKPTTATPTPTPISSPTPLIESSANSVSIDRETSALTASTKSTTNSTSTDEEPESASVSSEPTPQEPSTQSTTIQSSTPTPTPVSTPSATEASVQEEASSSGGLHSTAAIVGLIAAICVSLGAVVGVAVVVHKKRKLLEEQKNVEDRDSFASYASIHTPRSEVPVMHSAV